MIEQGIYFALGCIITALLALGFAPIFWTRALRLTRRRLQLQVPLSMQEILAERDQLRAEFAVERLRIEQAMARVQAGKAADMAAIGRHAVARTALEDELTTLKTLETAQETEIGALLREGVESSAEIGALKTALHAAHTLAERSEAQSADRHADNETLRDEAHNQRAMVASLKTRIAGLETRLVDTEKAERSRRESMEAGLRSRLEAAVAQAARHESSGISLRRECDEAKAHVRTLEDELARHEDERRRASDTTTRHGDELSALAKENQALRDALVDARRRVDADAATGNGHDDDEELRASIHALGLAVAVMTRQGRAPMADLERVSRAKPAKHVAPADAS